MIQPINPLKLTDVFRSLSRDQLNNVDFMSDFICTKIGLKINKKLLSIKAREDINCIWGNMNAKQYPNELAQFLIYICNQKIDSYLELGVERGGTFMLIDSLLRAINPNYQGSLGIDKDNRIMRSKFPDYHKKYTSCKFEQVNTHNFTPNQDYDLCFIDADHRYKPSRHDYNKIKSHAQIIAMHDIKFSKGVRQSWEEIKANNPQDSYIEITNNDLRFPGSVGFGIIEQF